MSALAFVVGVALTCPTGMVSVPGGELPLGNDHAHASDQAPAHRVALSPFCIDATLTTVAAFRAFVEATRHVSSAEHLGFGMVATEGMRDWVWKQLAGASWRHPFGPAHPELDARDEDPVVMVSWFDADAFCRHRGQRLPTEAEWEYAMRAGSTTRFPWGDDPSRDGKLACNFWQGDHRRNTRADGFVYVSPVRAFAPNAWGIYDPVGNVWQWTADWYAPDTYAAHGPHAVDPTGPATGTQKVARGGSWWCSRKTCGGFGLTMRGKALPDAPYANNGFRCVQARAAP